MGKNVEWETYREKVQRLSELEYNYDEKIYHDSKDKVGWYLDKYSASLAFEGPGEPIHHGPYEAVKSAIELYEFPDPGLIRAVFDPQCSLDKRNMLMLAKFAGFTFEFGVRVTSVIDKVAKNEKGEDVRSWGYSYRTLKGHFEIGEITFEVSKNLVTGEVKFAVNAYSKPDRIPNFFYRAGFKIFGRTLQRYFARSSIRRLKRRALAALVYKRKNLR